MQHTGILPVLRWAPSGFRMNERNHLSELMAFLQANMEKTIDSVTGRYSFPALVAYHHASKTKTFQTQVRVETDAWSDGAVSLAENNQSPSEQYHMDFHPKFQAMRYDRQSNILIITGKSEKMGSYQVTLSVL
jgi:hypothetical protein